MLIFIISMSSAWGKRMSSAWGKRMSSAWGKRADSDSDEFNANILRELLHQARLSKYAYPRYPYDNDGKTDLYYLKKEIHKYFRYYYLAYEQYLAQHAVLNNDDETVPQNMS